MNSDENSSPAPAPCELSPDATGENLRKGFSPVLVVLTVAVVLFVLWFGPRALRWTWQLNAPAASGHSGK